MLEEWNILLGIELYFNLCKFLFCFIMQTWLLVTWANSLYVYVPLFYDTYQVPDKYNVKHHTQSVAEQNNVQHNMW